MPWKKTENSFGIGKGDWWLWLRKIQFKEDHEKNLVANISKGSGPAVDRRWEQIGTIYLTKEDVQQLFYEIQEALKKW